jgi:TetR/AcrR family transcriptional regulator
VKDTFERLPDEKKERIFEACVDEFGERGFEGGSTDRVCRASGISKGGLYEYIDAKEELFLLAIARVYESLYNYIRDKLKRARKETPQDVLDRFYRVSEIAIDFYLDHPPYISLIQKANAITDSGLKAKVDLIFRESFLTVFGNLSGQGLRFPPQRIVDLMAWLLLKTRDDFLAGYGRDESPGALRKAYLKEWAFYVDALRSGIYRD